MTPVRKTGSGCSEANNTWYSFLNHTTYKSFQSLPAFARHKAETDAPFIHMHQHVEYSHILFVMDCPVLDKILDFLLLVLSSCSYLLFSLVRYDQFRNIILPPFLKTRSVIFFEKSNYVKFDQACRKNYWQLLSPFHNYCHGFSSSLNYNHDKNYGMEGV
jgi:hypothetical protein